MSEDSAQRGDGRGGRGKLFVVGFGPGGPLDRTRRAENAIAKSRVIAGYSGYIERIRDLIEGKETISTGMTREIDRCRAALERAATGETVALVSSGDPGVYGMAGLALEMAAAEGFDVAIEIVPGVTAASAAAARMGAPLMLDFCCVSLSDLLVSREMILKRIEAVAAADLVTALYNPKSKKRVTLLGEVAEIFRKHRPGSTPVGIATAMGSDDERVVLSDLDHFLDCEIGMTSIVLIGASGSKRIGEWFVTPRGYELNQGE